MAGLEYPEILSDKFLARVARDPAECRVHMQHIAIFIVDRDAFLHVLEHLEYQTQPVFGPPVLRDIRRKSHQADKVAFPGKQLDPGEF